jgi:hypothetical protein
VKLLRAAEAAVGEDVTAPMREHHLSHHLVALAIRQTGLSGADRPIRVMNF